MQKSLIIKTFKAIAFPYRELKNPLALENLNERPEFRYSPIYFVCRSKKTGFDLTKTHIQADKRILTVCVSFGNERKHFDVPLYSALTDNGPGYSWDRAMFETDLALNRVDVRLSYERSSSSTLFFEVITKKEKYTVQVAPEQFMNQCDLFPAGRSEIIYIGQSKRVITERIRQHRHLFDAIEKYHGNSVRLYFMSFNILAMGLARNHKIVNLVESSERDARLFKIDLAERLLINFFKPDFNNRHKNWNLRNDRYIKFLKSEGIETLCLDVEMAPGTGVLYSFYSNNQLFESQEAYLNLDSLTDGFIPKERFKLRPIKEGEQDNKQAILYRSFV